MDSFSAITTPAMVDPKINPDDPGDDGSDKSSLVKYFKENRGKNSCQIRKRDKDKRKSSISGPYHRTCPGANSGHSLRPMTYPITHFSTFWKSNAPTCFASAYYQKRTEIRTQALNNPPYPYSMTLAALGLVLVPRGVDASSLPDAQGRQPRSYMIPCQVGLEFSPGQPSSLMMTTAWARHI